MGYKTTVYEVEGYIASTTGEENWAIEIKIRSIIPNKKKIHSSLGYKKADWDYAKDAFHDLETVNVSADEVEELRKKMINNLRKCSQIEILERHFYDKWELKYT